MPLLVHLNWLDIPVSPAKHFHFFLHITLFGHTSIAHSCSVLVASIDPSVAGTANLKVTSMESPLCIVIVIRYNSTLVAGYWHIGYSPARVIEYYPYRPR